MGRIKITKDRINVILDNVFADEFELKLKNPFKNQIKKNDMKRTFTESWQRKLNCSLFLAQPGR